MRTFVLALLLPTPALAQVLTIDGACPGLIDLEVTGALPGTDVALVAARGPGAAVFPGGPCADVRSGLADPLRLLTSVRTPDGTVSLSPTVGGGACGASVVAVDLETCIVSAPAVIGAGVGGGFTAVDSRARAFGGPWTLHRVDVDAGVVVPVAEIEVGVTRITYTPEGRLVGLTAEDPPRLVAIDPDTGAFTPLLTTTFPFGHGSGIAWADGALWGWSEGGDHLVAFDLDAGTDTPLDVGLGTAANCIFTGADGTLYDVNGGAVYEVDTVGLVSTYVGAIDGFADGGAKTNGCTLHDGELYMNADFAPHLYRVDLATLTATATGIDLPEHVNGIASGRP
ncbi:MAG: hypothetical protein ACI8PZ_006206 [Myxococcota bacterium]|jgi:hypothetical protein